MKTNHIDLMTENEELMDTRLYSSNYTIIQSVTQAQHYLIWSRKCHNEIEF